VANLSDFAVVNSFIVNIVAQLSIRDVSEVIINIKCFQILMFFIDCPVRVHFFDSYRGICFRFEKRN
jgi:hypothetical protein